jgi:TM2 domain-containing membrane protein YozV
MRKAVISNTQRRGNALGRARGFRRMVILCLAAVSLAAAQAGQGRRPIGIPEIDSLPLQDWGTPTRPLSMPVAIGLAAVIPGGGQFYGGHPVRGSFLLGLETLLFGLSIYTYTVDLPRRDRLTRDYLDEADEALSRLATNPGDSTAASDLRFYTEQARSSAGLRLQYADLANSQLAWAAGLHFYGIADAIEIAYRSHHPVARERSVGRAFLYGLAFPGGGQLYNQRYGKFGLLWMALGASAVSTASRQNVVESLNRRLAVARAEGSPEIDQLEQDRQIFRRRRNQYYFGAGIFYIYALMDGMVDAALSDFDGPNRYAIGPGIEPFSVVATISF